ncbi:unnamed protein product, partial [Ceratitis capitata]
YPFYHEIKLKGYCGGPMYIVMLPFSTKVSSSSLQNAHRKVEAEKKAACWSIRY